jgi:hypothetical protein
VWLSFASIYQDEKFRLQEESCLRAQFFIYNQVSHNVKSQRGGHSTILILGQITGDRLPNLPLGLSLDTFCKALPVRLKKAYFTHCPDQEDGVDERSFLIKLLPVAISWAGSLFEDHFVPMFDSNRTDVLAQLQAAGFNGIIFHTRLAGRWSSKNNWSGSDV